MARVVMEATHSTIGMVQFFDYELPDLRQIETQRQVTRRTQSGRFTALWVGRDWFTWRGTFRIVFRTTLQKLSQLYGIQDEFTLRPILIDSPLSAFTVIWDGDSFEEIFRYGRASAQDDFTATFEEVVVGSCDIVS